MLSRVYLSVSYAFLFVSFYDVYFCPSKGVLQYEADMIYYIATSLYFVLLDFSVAVDNDTGKMSTQTETDLHSQLITLPMPRLPVYHLKPMDRVTLLHSKSTISLYTELDAGYIHYSTGDDRQSMLKALGHVRCRRQVLSLTCRRMAPIHIALGHW